MTNVLIAEDDIILTLINKQYVKKLGMEVCASVTTGENAVQACIQHKPDLILMDIRLKGAKNGIEAMSEINQFSDAKVLFISGNSDENTLTSVSQIKNIVGFLVKPIHFNELKSILKNHFEII